MQTNASFPPLFGSKQPVFEENYIPVNLASFGFQVMPSCSQQTSFATCSTSSS